MAFVGLDIAYISSKFFKYTFHLPNNRKHELEADTLGLFILARAGYAPENLLVCFEKLDKFSNYDTTDWNST